MDESGGGGGGGGGGVQKVPPRLPKICHINLTMMKLGTAVPSLKNIQKIKEITL